MSELSLEKETTKLEKYLLKEGRKDFIEEIRAASPETLDQKLLGLAKHAEEIRNTKEGDSELRKAKEHAKFLGSAYRDQLKMNSKLARFVALIMQEQGMIAETTEVESTDET